MKNNNNNNVDEGESGGGGGAVGGKNVLRDKSYLFALRVVRLYKYLQKRREFVLSKQLLRSGTAVGALVWEGKFAQSRADFVHKLSIALKEANETSYWLMLLKDSGYIKKRDFDSIYGDSEELVRLLVSIVRKCKVS